jgi:sortase A
MTGTSRMTAASGSSVTPGSSVWKRSKWLSPLGAAALITLFALAGWQLGQGLYIKAKAQLAQVLLETAWQESLQTGTPHKAWAWADTWPVARLTVPRLGISEIVLSNASGEALAFGPGQLSTTKLGNGGLSAVAGHRDTHFAFLKELRPGDRIELTTMDGEAMAYSVIGTEIVDSATTKLNPATGNGLVLVTCYPFDAVAHGPLRYLVFAKLVIL